MQVWKRSRSDEYRNAERKASPLQDRWTTSCPRALRAMFFDALEIRDLGKCLSVCYSWKTTQLTEKTWRFIFLSRFPADLADTPDFAALTWEQRLRAAYALDHRRCFGAPDFASVSPCGRGNELQRPQLWPLPLRLMDHKRGQLSEFAVDSGSVASVRAAPLRADHALFLPRGTDPALAPLAVVRGNADSLMLFAVDAKTQQMQQQARALALAQGQPPSDEWTPLYTLPAPSADSIDEEESAAGKRWIQGHMTVYDVDQRNNLAARWGFSWRGHGSLVLYRLEPQPAVIGSFQIGSDGGNRYDEEDERVPSQEVVVSCAFELRMEHKGDTLESYDLRTGELRHVVDVEDEERPIAMSLPAGSRHLCCLTRHHADLRLLNMSTGRVLRRWGVDFQPCTNRVFACSDRLVAICTLYRDARRTDLLLLHRNSAQQRLVTVPVEAYEILGLWIDYTGVVLLVSTADDGNVCVRVSFRAPTAADLSRAAKADLLASQGGSPLVLPLASPSGCSLS